MLSDVKGILFDIGGVLYVGEKAVEGAVDAVAKLKRRYPVRFLTNTTRSCPETILQKLRDFGFDVTHDELFTALSAAHAYVDARGGSVLPLLTDEAARCFDDLRGDRPDFVVAGDAHTNFDYAHLNAAFRTLKNGARLIAAAKNRYFQDDDGMLSMDAGGFVAALEYAAETQAILIGKPSATFFHLAVASMGLQAYEVLMVGDDIESDIQGAQNAGLKAALVKTGKFNPEDLRRDIRPDIIVEDVASLPPLLA